MSWARDDQSAGAIDLEARPNALILDYRIKRLADRDWRLISERIPLDATPCHYGSSRPWFRCPGCGTRRAVLYGAGGKFRCHDLAYSSTREDAIERHRRRADALRRRLGGRSGPYAVPCKPTRMH